MPKATLFFTTSNTTAQFKCGKTRPVGDVNIQLALFEVGLYIGDLFREIAKRD